MSTERDMPEPPPPPSTPPPSATSQGDSYLWDRTGTPDAEIVRLEESLQSMRYQGELGGEARWRISHWRSTRRRTLLATAAAAILLVGVVVMLVLPKPALQVPGWTLAHRSGDITIESMDLHDQLHAIAQRVTTSAGAKAMLVAKNGARFHLDSDSSASLADSTRLPRFQLERGRVYSETWKGPPCEVRTPAGLAIVTGDTAGLIAWRDEGRGVIELKTGHVEFHNRDFGKYESTGDPVPVRLLAGMTCDLSEAGASIPTSTSADPLYRKQLVMVAANANAKIDAKTKLAQLDELLARSRAEDAPTLWNLCWRVGPSERRTIAERLAMFLPVKGGIETDRDGTIDPGAMDKVWELIESSR